jgi:hypothetical protein
VSAVPNSLPVLAALRSPLEVLVAAPMSLNPLLVPAALTDLPVLAALRSPLMLAAPMSLNPLVPAELTSLELPVVPTNPPMSAAPEPPPAQR